MLFEAAAVLASGRDQRPADEGIVCAVGVDVGAGRGCLDWLLLLCARCVKLRDMLRFEPIEAAAEALWWLVVVRALVVVVVLPFVG